MPRNNQCGLWIWVGACCTAGGLLTAALVMASVPPADPAAKDASLRHGRYLVRITGCNDCHTPGYRRSAGRVPERSWLVGDRIGWRGPWGTTYPANLRLYMAGISADQWVQKARAMRSRPPMPWLTLRQMHEQDLRDIYRYIRALGPAGEPVPAFVPPNREPKTAYISFVPQPPKG
jgi:mono/diheme cytochrome c family protein